MAKGYSLTIHLQESEIDKAIKKLQGLLRRLILVWVRAVLLRHKARYDPLSF